jgi:non-heme chloroperoxidase
MPTITTKDGAQIFYKEWGKGPPVVFSHGWPLNADAWDDQLFFFASKGYRAIAHDRRGGGRSSQTSEGNDMDTYADDLSTVIDKLHVENAFLVGHSTGGGEVVRYIGRHGSKRVNKIALISAVPPHMLKTDANPGGVPMSVFDEIRAGLVRDRAQFYKDLSSQFYGANRAGSSVSEGLRHQFWLQCMQCGLKSAYECVKQFSEVDFTADLKKLEIPTLIIHGDDDQVVPIDVGGKRSAELVKKPALKVYPGAPHGLVHTLKDQLNADLLSFLRG